MTTRGIAIINKEIENMRHEISNKYAMLSRIRTDHDDTEKNILSLERILLGLEQDLLAIKAGYGDND